jgi:hypothetical protein
VLKNLLFTFLDLLLSQNFHDIISFLNHAEKFGVAMGLLRVLDEVLAEYVLTGGDVTLDFLLALLDVLDSVVS